MTLNDWVKNGWLREHRTSAQEIANLFAVVDREIADSQIARVRATGNLWNPRPGRSHLDQAGRRTLGRGNLRRIRSCGRRHSRRSVLCR